MSTAALTRGLAARLRDATDAADRLAAFCDEHAAVDAVPSVLAEGEELATAHDFVLRALAAAGDPLNFRILTAAAVHEDGAPLAALAGDLGLSRLALVERVHALIQLGLAARDLQAETVCATPAGAGLLELVTGLEAEVAQWLSKRRRR